MIELHFHFAEQQNDDGVREELQMAIGSTGESVLDLQIETERARFDSGFLRRDRRRSERHAEDEEGRKEERTWRILRKTQATSLRRERCLRCE